MSRNLCRTDCKYCPGEVVLVEQPRVLTPKEGGTYHTGMLAANAECSACLAQYLAWCSSPPGSNWETRNNEKGFYDLSFRHSFNDEPSDRDLPRYKVEARLVRVGLFADESAYAELGTLCSRCGGHVLRSPRGYGMPEGKDVCRQCDVDPWFKAKQEKERVPSAVVAASRAAWNVAEVVDVLDVHDLEGTAESVDKDRHVPPVKATEVYVPRQAWNEYELLEHGFKAFNWERGIVIDIETRVFLCVLGAPEPVDFKKVREDWNLKQKELKT
jgi:hypothetical protein